MASSILIHSQWLLVLFYALTTVSQTGKMNGVNLVGERSLPDQGVYQELESMGVNTVALNPFAYGSRYVPMLEFDSDWQWKGETTPGIIRQVLEAKRLGMTIVLKPHLWIMETGWAGELEFENGEEWKLWHQSYRNYIMHYARLADSLQAEVLCIGTELKSSIRQDPEFWKSLIADVRLVYSGQLTYAANWDNYQSVPFWEALDFISVDAYFPCDTSKTVTLEVLLDCLQTQREQLLTFAGSVGKPVLFTEFGFRSIHHCCAAQWELPSVERDPYQNINYLNQVLAYRAFFKTFWPSSQVLGGCLWKWYPEVQRDGENNDYTPQGKPASEVVRSWYEAFARRSETIESH